MTRDYKKFGCFGCGYTWEGWAKIPKCPKCGKKKIKEELMALPEYSAEKKPSNKLINDIEKLREDEIIEEINEDNKAPEIENENFEEQEEVKFNCATCRFEVYKGDLYCNNCGESLLWEHLN